jgi:8-amino-7-oxononanoate synthase
MHTSLETILTTKLEQREESGLKRTLKSGNENLIDFASNDYLGLARSADLSQMIEEQVHRLKLKNGSTGSRLLTGNSAYQEEVESLLANIFKAQSALIFNSGYTANLAVLSAIPSKDDTIIYDELAHACIKDGARLSLAKRFNFRHNDLDDLEAKIKKALGKIFIAIESIYSMDGDECPLTEIVALAEKYNAVIILDEAHSTGIKGDNGSGLAVKNALEHKVDIRIHTFGKAMGIHGACVVGSENLTEYLINFARPFIYTTALTPHSIASIHCAFEFLAKNIRLQEKLTDNIQSFLAHCESIRNRTASKSAIQTFVVPGNDKVKEVANRIQSHGFDVRPILSPTVPVQSERLRICLHAYNSASEIKNFCDLLQTISKS